MLGIRELILGVLLANNTKFLIELNFVIARSAQINSFHQAV